MNTKVRIAGVEFKNPVMTASGTFGSGMEYAGFVDLNRLGAVVTKGVANVPWEGNPTPRIAETYGGMLNAIGLQNPGIDVFIERDIPFLKKRQRSFNQLEEIPINDIAVLKSYHLIAAHAFSHAQCKGAVPFLIAEGKFAFIPIGAF